MAKYYKREIADLNGVGSPQYRYEIRSAGNVDLKELAQRVHNRHHTLSVAELEGIMSDFISEMATQLASGRSVTLDELGCFSLGIGLRKDRQADAGADVSGEPNARSLCVRNVSLKVNPHFLNRVDNMCRLEREEGGAAQISVSPYSSEERVARAVGFMTREGFMRIADYARLNNVSKSVASRELARLDADPASPIIADGRGPARVYRLSGSVE